MNRIRKAKAKDHAAPRVLGKRGTPNTDPGLKLSYGRPTGAILTPSKASYNPEYGVNITENRSLFERIIRATLSGENHYL